MLNYMWLPTFIGVDTSVKQRLEAAVANKFIGRPLTDDLLVEMHNEVVQTLTSFYPALNGLRDYLDSMKFVTS